MRELNLLQHIYGSSASLPESVTIGPGDDMGMVHIGGNDVLVTVDQLADGVHFDLAATPLQKVARKAITRNLSDVAAMAAQPVGAVAAVSLPKDFGDRRANELFDAMRATAEAYRCPLLGGDISMWNGALLLTVTVLAEPAGIAPITRRGAQVGDVVCVTGQLGGSLETIDGPTPYTHHLDFEPRIALARMLAADANLDIHCMIDLSDGLAKDLSHICRGSGVAAEVVTDGLPISPAAHRAAHRDQQPPWRHALADGEDYELCFTIPQKQVRRSLPKHIDGVAITPIGVITPADDGPIIMLKLPDGSLQPADDLGWEHRS